MLWKVCQMHEEIHASALCTVQHAISRMNIWVHDQSRTKMRDDVLYLNKLFDSIIVMTHGQTNLIRQITINNPSPKAELTSWEYLIHRYSLYSPRKDSDLHTSLLLCQQPSLVTFQTHANAKHMAPDALTAATHICAHFGIKFGLALNTHFILKAPEISPIENFLNPIFCT